jgi:arylsulfatase
VKHSFPVIFNLRADPYESFDSTADRSAMVQTKQWLEGPINQVLHQHVQLLMQYPPVQKAATFDFSKIMEQMQKGAQ